jgi:hypothetical protein
LAKIAEEKKPPTRSNRPPIGQSHISNIGIRFAPSFTPIEAPIVQKKRNAIAAAVSPRTKTVQMTMIAAFMIVEPDEVGFSTGGGSALVTGSAAGLIRRVLS